MAFERLAKGFRKASLDRWGLDKELARGAKRLCGHPPHCWYEYEDVLIWDGWEWVDGPGASSNSSEAVKVRARLVGGPAPACAYGDDPEDKYDLDKIAFAAVKGQGLFHGGFDFGAVASAFGLDEHDLAYDAD